MTQSTKRKHILVKEEGRGARCEYVRQSARSRWEVAALAHLSVAVVIVVLLVLIDVSDLGEGAILYASSLGSPPRSV